MLLSEMFGVERDTEFGVEGYSVTFKIATFLEEYEYLMYRWSAVLDWREAEGTLVCRVIAAAPSGIIHLPPPLTDEQREQLKAIWTLGYRWLVKSKHCQVHAFEERPNKFELNYYWLSESGSVYYCSTKPSDCLAYLVSWSDPEPFDIGKALGIKN